MAYGDTVDPKSRVISVILVGVITFLLGWLLVSGLAIDVVKQAMKKLDVMDIQEPPPPEEPPPPPPPDNNLPPPPPMVIPRSIIPPVAPTNVVTNTVERAPPTPAPIVIPSVVAPPAAPSQARGARPRGNAQSWVTTDDYPSSAQREGAEGTTGTRMTISAEGRVTACDVTSSSGNSALDQAACRNLMRRARYEPALDRDGHPISASATRNVRWQLPEE